MAPTPSTPASQRPKGISGTLRSLGGWRTHAPSVVAFLACAALGTAAFFWLSGRAQTRARAALDQEATSVVSNLRSALERPLEILEASGALFEASEDVTRSEFGKFVKPALERHPGVRALEWIPIVPGSERASYEAAARADGLTGFEFRERDAAGNMVSASERSEHLPIYYMEPGHPLVLGFDCASDPERLSIAEHARTSGTTAASLRIRLLDDPPSVYSVVAFRPVYAVDRTRSPATVRGFACEVFRVRAVAERAIEDSVRRGIEVALLDPTAPPDKRVLFESSPSAASSGSAALRFEAPLRYADRDWQLVLTAAPGYKSELESSAWLALMVGLALGTSCALGISAFRIVRRLRGQVRAAQRLGQYTLLEKLGQGGVGVVHKARHAMLRRPTAIKFLAQAGEDPRTLARFEREVQLTSELSHPNTIAIYDYGRTPDGVFYYVMEYIDGITLEELVKRAGPLPPARVVHLLKQACQALAEAHEAGLIHRDIKPANLMVCRRGGIPDFIKVMDFGLVKDIAAATSLDISQSATAILGTPLYMAPETISRPEVVDARADLYALGAVAYFLLVGEPVFKGPTVVEVCTQHLLSEPVPPSARGAELPGSLERVVLRCLAKDPSFRFASARALYTALAELADVDAWREDQAHAWWQANAKPSNGAERYVER